MKHTRLQMGMPITVEVLDASVTSDDVESVFAYFAWVDTTFSTYNASSEISRLNRGELTLDECCPEVQGVLALCEQTKLQTQGYFDARRAGVLDPSGIVKGWAIQEAAQQLTRRGLRNFYVNAGGDVQVSGTRDGQPWRVGIRNPFNRTEHVKVLCISDAAVATSGTAVRGQHIYDPHHPDMPLLEISSITVVGANIYDADRFATAAFAMGRAGIQFINELPGFEGYMIDTQAHATYTRGLERYLLGT